MTKRYAWQSSATEEEIESWRRWKAAEKFAGGEATLIELKVKGRKSLDKPETTLSAPREAGVESTLTGE